MRHGKRKKIGRNADQKKALLRSLSISLIRHRKIETTLPKAKVLRPFIEKLITVYARLNRQDSIESADILNAHRHAVRVLGSGIKSDWTDDEGIVAPLFQSLQRIGEGFSQRPGGYVRIVKLANRYGDAAPMARIELIADDVQTVI